MIKFLIINSSYHQGLAKECNETEDSYLWFQKSQWALNIKFIKFETGVIKPEKLEAEIYNFVDVDKDFFDLETSQARFLIMIKKKEVICDNSVIK